MVYLHTDCKSGCILGIEVNMIEQVQAMLGQLYGLDYERACVCISCLLVRTMKVSKQSPVG